MVTVFHHTPVNAVFFKQFDGLNFDGPAGKHQKCQISPIKILHYTVFTKCSKNKSLVQSFLHSIQRFFSGGCTIMVFKELV